MQVLWTITENSTSWKAELMKFIDANLVLCVQYAFKSNFPFIFDKPIYYTPLDLLATARRKKLNPKVNFQTDLFKLEIVNLKNGTEGAR